MNDPILGLIGLCRKAGRLAIGDEPVKDSIRSGKARLICLAGDASENTVRKARNYGASDQVPIQQLSCTKEELGGMLGRKSCAMVAVEDAGFAKAIRKKITMVSERYGGGPNGN